MTQSGRKSLFEKPLLSTKVKSANVKPVEMLLGYLVGPFCAMLANGIFTTYLTRYFRDVLFAEELAAGSALAGSIETFLTLFPILSAILIVIGNLVAGQIVERTRTKAGKARPWILLSAVLLAVSGMLIFIQPSNDPTFKMVWLVIAYNLYYAVAFPLYNTANSTLTPLSTRNGKQRSVLASLVNMSLLGATGAGSMIFPILLGLLISDDMSLGEQKSYWLVLFIIVAVITFFGTILQYYFTRERVTEERASVAQKEGKKGASVREQAKASSATGFLDHQYLLFSLSVQRRHQEHVHELLCGESCDGRAERRLHSLILYASSRRGGRALQRGGFLPGGRNAKIFLKKV